PGPAGPRSLDRRSRRRAPRGRARVGCRPAGPRGRGLRHKRLSRVRGSVAGDLILALDQGTTSSRAIAFDRGGLPVASAQQPFEQRFPSPGHVTHDPEALWSSQLAVACKVVAAAGGVDRIAAIGITNQRETTIVWDRATGAPV